MRLRKTEKSHIILIDFFKAKLIIQGMLQGGTIYTQLTEQWDIPLSPYKITFLTIADYCSLGHLACTERNKKCLLILVWFHKMPEPRLALPQVHRLTRLIYAWTLNCTAKRSVLVKYHTEQTKVLWCLLNQPQSCGHTDAMMQRLCCTYCNLLVDPLSNST